MSIWYILWSFGKFFPALVCCTEKNLATLMAARLRLNQERAVNDPFLETSQPFHVDSGTGLPDGLFSNQKSQIWVNFGGPLNGQCWYIL
jgi:hypothetical protein